MTLRRFAFHVGTCAIGGLVGHLAWQAYHSWAAWFVCIAISSAAVVATIVGAEE